MALSTSVKTGTLTTVALALSAAAAAAAFVGQRQAAPPEAHACIFSQQAGIHSASPSRDCLTGWGGCQLPQFATRPWCQNAFGYENIYQCLQTQIWTQVCEDDLNGLRNRGAYVPPSFVSPGVTQGINQGVVTLSPTSPSGSIPPSMQNVLRLNLAVNSAQDAAVDSWTFSMYSEDEYAAGWNTCGELQAADVSLYNFTADGLSISLEDDLQGDWAFFDEAGVPCGPLNSGEVVRSLVLTTDRSDELAAGMTYAYYLYFDSSGAGLDDSLRFDLTSLSPMSASQLPVRGNTLVF